MESLLNYLAYKSKNKVVYLLPFLIMQLEKVIWKLVSIFWLFLSETDVLQGHFEIYLRFTGIPNQRNTMKNRP